jgi:hypothetical protein
MSNGASNTDGTQWKKSGCCEALVAKYGSDSKFIIGGDKGYVHAAPPAGWRLVLTKTADTNDEPDPDADEEADGRQIAPKYVSDASIAKYRAVFTLFLFRKTMNTCSVAVLLTAVMASLVHGQTTPGLTKTPSSGTTNGLQTTSAVVPSSALTTTCWCACDGLDRYATLKEEKSCNEVAVCNSCGSCSNGYARACAQGFLCKDTKTSASVTSCAFLQCGATDDCACRGLTIQCALERGCTVEPEFRSRCSTACASGKATNGDAKNCTATPLPTTTAAPTVVGTGAASALEIGTGIVLAAITAHLSA